MEEEKDKLYQYFNHADKHEASSDLTDSVMNSVESIVDAPFIVKPLISSKAWIYIFISALFVIAGSFGLELTTTIKKVPLFFDWENIAIRDFTTSIKIGIVVLSMLLILTMADIVYRRMKKIA